jgi:hypothetical protein
MVGALDLTEPKHLLAKLEHECRAVLADRGDRYAAINALRDAYHLREWIWHDRLETEPVLQAAVKGSVGTEQAWNEWVIQQFPDFPLIRELCNGSKHFEHKPDDKVAATHQGGLDSKVPFFDNPYSGFDDKGLHVEVDQGRIVSTVDLVTRVRDFWADLFKHFPQLS